MEPLGLSYEESQYLDELENDYCPMTPADLFAEHKQWLEQVQVVVQDVEDEKWQIVDWFQQSCPLGPFSSHGRIVYLFCSSCRNPTNGENRPAAFLD